MSALVQKIFGRFWRSKNTIQCYLCMEEIASKDWEDGSHRIVCMQRENCKLSSTSREQNLKCPKCGKKMRILIDKNVIFQCNSELSCPNKERCQDKQRYNCFLCDFDICIVCGSTLEEENVGELEVESLYDKMLRFSESPDRQHQPVRVTSLRTLCLSSDKSRQANVRGQTIVLRETATNTEPFSPCGPSEI